MTLSILKSARNAFAATAFAALLALATPAALHAQSVVIASRVNIPFAFEVGDSHFAPGSYNLTMVTSRVMEIRGAQGTAQTLVRPDETGGIITAGKAIFHHVGDRYFLHAVLTAGHSAGMECPKSKAEAAAERTELAQRAAKPGTVELALAGIPR